MKDKYTAKNIIDFLKAIKFGCDHPELVSGALGHICKSFKIGVGNSRYALEAGGFVEFKGKGFKNLTWTGPETIINETAFRFIALLRKYNKALKEYRKKKNTPAPAAPPKTIEPTRGEQAGLPFPEEIDLLTLAKMVRDVAHRQTVVLNLISDLQKQIGGAA